MIKYYRFTYDYVLWELSYANLTLLLSGIPETDFGDEETDNTDNASVMKMGKPHNSAEKKEMDMLKSFFKAT